MSAYQNTNDEVLVSSRMYWWANLLLLLAIALVVMMLWDLGTGARFILKKLDDTLIVFSVVITPVFFSVWSIRRVLVYEDRIEVRFPLRRSRNHVIYLKDVDGYGMAMRETMKFLNPKETEEVSYVFLITRGRLLYYMLVDYIDADTLGTVCKRRELKEENGSGTKPSIGYSK